MLSLLKSYAKINIGLRILGKRNDGYHNIETIFYPVKLNDEIVFEINKTSQNYNSVILKSNKSYIPLTKDNLCYKAVEDFFKSFRITDCFKINLEIRKNIPVGGGLAGGSSNAASILKFLIKFFNIDIQKNREKILDLALSIGSDVPFFLTLKPCYAEGRGEKLVMLPDFKIDYYILIVNPNLHVSTKWAFEKLNLTPSDIKKPVLIEVRNFEIEKSNLFTNDFEEVVFKKYNLLSEIKDKLKEMGAVYASMSGSGATMYGFFDKKKRDTLYKCRDYFKMKNYFTYLSD